MTKNGHLGKRIFSNENFADFFCLRTTGKYKDNLRISYK